MSNTPYDNAFRTLLTDCKRLIIPLVNEMFNEQHDYSEKVELFQNELFITAGGDKKRITDSNFSVGNNVRRYNIECQSSPDGSIIIRVFEYASQIAVVTAENNVSETHFTLPQSGIIYLRYSKETPNIHKIVIDTPNGNISYDVPIIKIGDYTLETILKEKLWFLLPFHFFTFKLDELENDSEKLSQMLETYSNLWNTLETLVSDGIITEFEKNSIKAMCDEVASSLAMNYTNVKKGVDDVMGGAILDYEARRISINSFIEGMLEGNASEDSIVNRLISKYQLTVDVAKDAIQRVKANSAN